jgi:hypothetical protein
MMTLVKLSVIYVKCLVSYSYAECQYAECHYGDCLGVKPKVRMSYKLST